MKCHYTYDQKGKKHFIPMCLGTIYSFNKKDCCCPDPLTDHHFEKERYNKVLSEKNETISMMQSEINHLKKVIVHLNKTTKNSR
jgi:hypothetical protein